MKQCNQCGAELEDNQKFCSNCGAAQYEAQKSAQTEQKTEQQQADVKSSIAAGAAGTNAGGNRANSGFGGSDHTAEFDPSDVAANKIYGILAVFGILFFVPLVACPDSKYGRYWANQGLVLLLFGAACSILSLIVGGILGLLSGIPFIGFLFTIANVLFNLVIGVISFAMFLIALINACKGQAKDLPLIGKITIIK